MTTTTKRRKYLPKEGFGRSVPPHRHDHNDDGQPPHLESFTYLDEESDTWHARQASIHYMYHGRFWNEGKHGIMVRYRNLAALAVVQATVAYCVNLACETLTKEKFDAVGELLSREDDHASVLRAFAAYYLRQTFYALWAAVFVYAEPVAAGSGIPEVKCFLNGVDLPRVTDLRTGLCKVIGVVGSVSGGLPVGKEGPMVHSGAAVASSVSRGTVRDDKERRDYVACGAAAGVCTAFSAPVGGILFALEEGCSYWSPSLTFRTFFTAMLSIATLYGLNTVGTRFGKVGFDKLFSFGSFDVEGDASSWAVFELVRFGALGVGGGLIGACFNDSNERLTKWRMKKVNRSRKLRVLEVLVVSTLVSVTTFCLPLFWSICRPLPDDEDDDIVATLVRFRCPRGQYDEVASLSFNEAGRAIRLLFHTHDGVFSPGVLVLFFSAYVTLAVITYGIAVPSGLFVPSLLSGAALGRFVGTLVRRLGTVTEFDRRFAHYKIYSLVGAASVLGGMARMTISLTVILLECTGNEQFVLPLMISQITARIVGNLFNTDLYHIHVHLKKGVAFLEAELRSVTRRHDLLAGHVMGRDVVFVRPIERAGTLRDLLSSCAHFSFPVVDTDDRDVLCGTVDRRVLSKVLERRVRDDDDDDGGGTVELGPYGDVYVPLLRYGETMPSGPNQPRARVEDVRLDDEDRDRLVDLRPYVNTAPYSIPETASVHRAYTLFRTLGCRMLVVVNRYNQCVGTITRNDLTAEALARDLVERGRFA